MSFTNGSHGINKPFIQRISLPSLKNKMKNPTTYLANGDEMHNPYVQIFYLQAQVMRIHHILCKLLAGKTSLRISISMKQ
jgi:hypothetical protein